MWTAALTLVVLAQPLSLNDVLGSVDQSAPQLVAAQADLEASRADALSANGGFDPSLKVRAFGSPGPGELNSYPQLRLDAVVEAPTPLWGTSLFAGYRLGVGSFADYYGERKTYEAGELRAGVSVPVLRNGPTDRRRTTLAKSELGVTFATLSRAQQRLELRRLAATRYWEWVAAGARARMAQALLEVASTRDAQLIHRVRSGDAATFDQQDNERAVHQRRALLAQAERGIDQAALELSFYWRDANGVPQVPQRAAMPELELVTAPAPTLDAATALARRPDVARALNALEQQKLEVNLARNQLLPGVDVGVSVARDLGAAPSSGVKPGANEFEIFLSVDVPLLLRQPLGRLAAAQATLSRLEQQARSLKDRVGIEVADAASALQRAIERLQASTREKQLASQVEEGERKRFELGESTLLMVNLREVATAEAQLRQIDAVLDYHRAVATAEAVMAKQE